MPASWTVRFPALAFLPFAGLAYVLRRLPEGRSGAAMPWSHALAHAAVLAALLLAHAMCYERWHPRAPGRILLNELLTRAWFTAFGTLLVGLHGPNGPWFLALAAPWAALTWLVHRDQVRKEGY